MIVYGSPLSPFVRKVLAFCAEKGIVVENRPTRIGDTDPAFRAASPFGKMPALVDGDYALADSSAIIHYFEALHPEPALIPAEPRARGKVVWFEEFADTILFGCGQKMFFNRMVAPRFLGIPGDEAAAAKAEAEELPPILDYLETVAPDGDGYLVGNALTLADLAVVSPFANFAHLGIRVDEGSHPRLAAYVARILSRPSFAASIEKERATIARFAA
ncbi:glutathione S-transferase family protein [Sphingomonas ginkgonis]|uniref:Glutathione S-transferase family protein n=1 Tax=Sphingomonas ginkgonis TaxID=2315330 RepID=A0A429VDK7_9SPHN|nr:glutathione S-transferase family protein [Sphingomonas ginkgonis]RST31912.1 glutathione S-transferase family protein [Sphingomonas ginkgonis]